MRLRTIIWAAAFAGLVHTPGFAQNAELNCFIDNVGLIYLNGELVDMPARESDTARDTTWTRVTVRPGKNVFGLVCRNSGWTGGFVASIDLSPLGVADTFRTDGSWMCIDDEPGAPAWYTDTNFAESGWMPAGDYGPLADDTGGNAKPFFERYALEPANLWYHKAHWLWTPKTCYIRRSFQHAGGAASMFVRGSGMTGKLYLNGQEVADWPEMLNKSDLKSFSPTLLAGENVIALEATCVDSIHFAFLKAGVIWGPRADSKLLSDTTWRYSWENPSGWNNTGFSDDSWQYIDSIGAYDSRSDALNTPGCMFVWPGVMSFRKVFDVGPTIGVRSLPAPRAATLRAAPTQWYSLTGRRIDKQRAITAAMGVVIEAAPGNHTAARVNMRHGGR